MFELAARFAEFMVAELGGRMRVGSWSARAFVAGASAMRHRLPLIWAPVGLGRRASGTFGWSRPGPGTKAGPARAYDPDLDLHPTGDLVIELGPVAWTTGCLLHAQTSTGPQKTTGAHDSGPSRGPAGVGTPGWN